MSKTTEALSTHVNELPPAERLELVDLILGSLDVADPALDALWLREAEDRLAAWRRGEVRAVPLAEVLKKLGRA
jgi:putative addiction module component (TIGR02574 family)